MDSHGWKKVHNRLAYEPCSNTTTDTQLCHDCTTSSRNHWIEEEEKKTNVTYFTSFSEQMNTDNSKRFTF